MNTQNDYAAALASTPTIIFSLVLAVLMIVAMWKIFTKAGEPGWYSIIPFLNVFVLFRIAGLSPWLFLLLLIPLVNIVIAIMLALKLGAAFGKSGVWSFFLLVVFATIGYLILGYGSAEYRRPTLA
ncbi:MAG: hypothetical protein KDB60_05725 [Propionibacteriaceae bacterium]|nr:hypothetical protein [Propionibacteriaceae bacterium]